MAKQVTDKRKHGGRASRNEVMRITAHERLDQLLDESERGKTYGWVAVDVLFANGEIETVRRRIDATDKPIGANIPQ